MNDAPAIHRIAGAQVRRIYHRAKHDDRSGTKGLDQFTAAANNTPLPLYPDTHLYSLSPICFMKVTRSYMRFSSTICSLSHFATV